jgi:hypothetical protein
MASNLPSTESNPDKELREFFDGYFVRPLSFPSNELDATVGYFKSRGFGDVAANAVAVVLLRQAKTDGVKIFELLDKLQNISDSQLTAAIVEILNYDREAISALGFRRPKEFNGFETRNILL